MWYNKTNITTACRKINQLWKCTISGGQTSTNSSVLKLLIYTAILKNYNIYITSHSNFQLNFEVYISTSKMGIK